MMVIISVAVYFSSYYGRTDLCHHIRFPIASDAIVWENTMQSKSDAHDMLSASLSCDILFAGAVCINDMVYVTKATWVMESALLFMMYATWIMASTSTLYLIQLRPVDTVCARHCSFSLLLIWWSSDDLDFVVDHDFALFGGMPAVCTTFSIDVDPIAPIMMCIAWFWVR